MSNSTIYRWIHGSGAKAPSPEQIVAFCDALDLDPAVPFRILWPGRASSSDDHRADQAPDIDPVVAAIARKLEDPNLPDSERDFLRETLRMLAARPSQTAESRTVRRGRR